MALIAMFALLRRLAQPTFPAHDRLPRPGLCHFMDFRSAFCCFPLAGLGLVSDSAAALDDNATAKDPAKCYVSFDRLVAAEVGVKADAAAKFATSRPGCVAVGVGCLGSRW
jgi:hypothetical protein